VKRQRRVEATAAEVENQVASLRELDALAERSDGDLFLVDRGGSKTAKTKVAAVSGGSSSLRSATEKKLVQKIINNKNNVDATQNENKLALSDLWDDNEQEEIVKVSRPLVKRAAPVVSAVRARAGQSYHPEPSHHQAILAEVSGAKSKYMHR
jgi:hypothetical protein